METVLRSCKSVVFYLSLAMVSACCLLLSPTTANAQADLTEVDCMAAANPDACISQLAKIADQAAAPAPANTPVSEAAASTPVSSVTPATETTTTTSNAQSTEAAKPAATSSQETKQPVKRAGKKHSPSSMSKPTTTSQPAVTLAGTSPNNPATVQTPPSQPAATTQTPASQPATAVTLAGTPATPMPQPTPPVYKSTVTPEPAQPDLIADTMACQKTADPDACVRNLTNKQGAPATFNPNSLPLNSDALGWSGPVKAALRYDSELSWIVGLDYVQMLSESVGVSIKTGLGPREHRANITAGFSITPNQQFKATYEYLAQDLDFDFTTGTTREWVDQNAIGAAYQYLLRNDILHSIELSGYTVRANSKNLSDVVYNVKTAGNETTSYDVNYRRIAGGTENTVEAALKMLLTKNTSLTVGGGYSSISYDTQYEDNQAKKTIAYQAHLTHLLTDKFKLMTGIDSTASGTTQTAELRHIFNNIELSLKGEHMSSDSLPSSNSMTVGISYPAPKAYSVEPFGTMMELKNWIEKPVVYETRVLAIKDERVIHVLPTKNDFVQTIYTSNPVGQTTPDLTKIIPIPMTSMFTFQDPGLTINYTCQVTAPSTEDCGTLLNLAVGVPPSSQGTQLFSTASVPSTVASSTAYTVTITATGTRPGLANPVVEKGTLTLNVYATPPTFPAANIVFDATGGAEVPTAPLTVTVNGLHPLADGINLNTTAAGGSGDPATRTFTFADPANPPAYWQIIQYSGSYYLLRNLDAEGRLNAQDINTTVSIPLCVYEKSESSQCAEVPISITVKPDTAGSIHVDAPTPFQIPSNSTVTGGWDLNPVSVSSLVTSEVSTSNPVIIPIINDVYSGWTTPSLVAPSPAPPWPAPLAFSAVSHVTNSGSDLVAPPVATETVYTGTFNVSSVAKGGLVGTGNTSFEGLVTEANLPMIWDTTAKSIRFDLTNGSQDPGLKPQSGDTVIDLTAMVKDTSNNVVEGTTFSWANSSDPLTANWAFSFCPAPLNTAHTCLFRATKTSGSSIVLQAGDIGQKAPLICASFGSSTSCQTQTTQNFTVTADTHIRSDNQKYIQGFIPNNNPIRTMCKLETLSINLNPTTLNSYFVGQTLTLPGSAILITGDTFSQWTDLSVTPSADVWEIVPTLNQYTGILSGEVKNLSGSISYNGKYTFSALSKAAGGAALRYGSEKVFFYLKVINPCNE